MSASEIILSNRNPNESIKELLKKWRSEDMEQELALRYNNGKPPLVFILDFPNAVEGLSRVKQVGADKYALHNWKKGRGFRDTLSSLLRHLYASQTEAFDPETGCPHIDHVMWNAMALAEWYRTHPELNDWGPNLDAQS